MNILLIQPRMNKRPMDTDLKTRMAPSLALLTLKALTPKGHTVRILNENLTRFSPHRALFGGYPADLAAITVTVDVFPRAAELAGRLRAMGVPVVAGGIHITACPEDCLPHFTAICVGMAEPIWADVLRDAEAGRLGGVYGGAVASGDEICPPDYAAARAEKSYLYTNVLTTSRGCPHRCDFCYNSCPAMPTYLNRPLEDAVADIRALGTQHVMFVDDNFIGNPAWTRALLERIRPMGLTWHAAVTTRLLHHPDLLDLMAETGCQSLFIGFESINPQSLRGVHKQNRVEEYSALVAAIHRRGIMVNASMVFGLDGDDAGVFDATLAWLVENRVETLTSHIMTPYPGTALYRRLEAEGRIVDRDLAHYNTARVVFRPLGMTPEALQRGYLRMYRRFYSLRNIARRYPRHPKQQVAYLLFNLLYRKWGRFTSALSRLVPLGILGRLAALIAYPPAKASRRAKLVDEAGVRAGAVPCRRR